MGLVDGLKNAGNNVINTVKNSAIGKGTQEVVNDAQKGGFPDNYVITEVGTTNLADTLIQDPKMFAEKILKNSAVTCSVTLPVQEHKKEGDKYKTTCVTTTIPFYTTSDFSLGTLTNKWNSLLNSDLTSLVDILNKVGAVRGRSQVTMQSELLSSKVWGGTDFSGFSVDCVFVATRRTLNPTIPIRMLASAALPSKLASDDYTAGEGAQVLKDAGVKLADGIASIGNKIGDAIGGDFGQGCKDAVTTTCDMAKEGIKDLGMVAPLHYGLDWADGKGKPIKHTTLTLQVGDWFRASELLLQNISNIQFSKEVIAPPVENGVGSRGDYKAGDMYFNFPIGDDHSFPLWGRCTLSFIPVSLMHLDKFRGYFIDHASNKGGTLEQPLRLNNSLTLPS